MNALLVLGKILDYNGKLVTYKHLEKKAVATTDQHRFTKSKFTGLLH